MRESSTALNIEIGKVLYKKCHLYLLLSCIAMIFIFKVLLMYCLSNLGGISFFDFEEAISSLFPYILGFVPVAIAYKVSNKAFKTSLLLHIVSYLYSYLYIYFTFKGCEWMFYPLTSQQCYINLLQITIGTVYPAYLIICGIQLWRLCTNQDIKSFIEASK